MHAGPDARLEDKHILENLSDRLLVLAADTEKVCNSVADLTARLTTTLSEETIQDLQKLDNLHQSLCDLASLSKALAGPFEHRAQALGRLKLNATRTLVEAKQAERVVAHGTVDLF